MAAQAGPALHGEAERLVDDQHVVVLEQGEAAQEGRVLLLLGGRARRGLARSRRSGGTRMPQPASSRSLGFARRPLTRTSPLRTMRWMWVKATLGNARTGTGRVASRPRPGRRTRSGRRPARRRGAARASRSRPRAAEPPAARRPWARGRGGAGEAAEPPPRCPARLPCGPVPDRNPAAPGRNPAAPDRNPAAPDRTRPRPGPAPRLTRRPSRPRGRAPAPRSRPRRSRPRRRRPPPPGRAPRAASNRAKRPRRW